MPAEVVGCAVDAQTQGGAVDLTGLLENQQALSFCSKSLCSIARYPGWMLVLLCYQVAFENMELIHPNPVIDRV
ncbi:hypothetical protein [Hydrogenophaga sp.]|uniref:hypothetical protein n=1 Tax=Hydrogenophaga sp. TaxID=1904254 RepID=UPI0027334214|nr:hypothetical protein [Hydrogenophaga sp.]MDP3886420.1 hypothetical protein [Hydrogenophaga sp.]